MKLFSLEEDDCNDLFITQESCNDSVECKEKFLGGDPMDFGYLRSLISSEGAQYSDISDDEFMDIPSSQKANTLERR